jgi:hypothetical protein
MFSPALGILKCCYGKIAVECRRVGLRNGAAQQPVTTGVPAVLQPPRWASRTSARPASFLVGSCGTTSNPSSEADSCKERHCHPSLRMIGQLVRSDRQSNRGCCDLGHHSYHRTAYEKQFAKNGLHFLSSSARIRHLPGRPCCGFTPGPSSREIAP